MSRASHNTTQHTPPIQFYKATQLTTNSAQGNEAFNYNSAVQFVSVTNFSYILPFLWGRLKNLCVSRSFSCLPSKYSTTCSYFEVQLAVWPCPRHDSFSSLLYVPIPCETFTWGWN